METANKVTARIVWSGQGGELDSVTVTYGLDDDKALTRALSKLIKGGIVAPGDSFQILQA